MINKCPRERSGPISAFSYLRVRIRWRLVPAGLVVIAGGWLAYIAIVLGIGITSTWKIEENFLSLLYISVAFAELCISSICCFTGARCIASGRRILSLVLIMLAVALFLGYAHHKRLHSEELRREFYVTPISGDISFRAETMRETTWNSPMMRQFEADSSFRGPLQMAARRFEQTKICASDVEELKALGDDLETLEIIDCTLDEAVLSAIGSLPNLRTLNLAYTNVTDEDLKKLFPRSNLHTLVLNYTRITDAAIPAVCENPELERLGLAGTSITDVGLEVLSENIQLKQLDIADTKISDLSAARLAAMKTLESICVSSNPSITNASIEQLAKLPRLKYLVVGNTSVDEQCLPALLQMRNLRIFIAPNTGITRQGMQRLRDELPNFGRIPKEDQDDK